MTGDHGTVVNIIMIPVDYDCVYDLISLVTQSSSNVLPFVRPGTSGIRPGINGGLEFPDVCALYLRVVLWLGLLTSVRRLIRRTVV